MVQHLSLLLVLLVLFFSEDLSASSGSQNSLEIFKQKDYFVKRAKLELAKQSRKQFQFVLKQTHLFHVEHWKKDRQQLIESLSQNVKINKADLQDYITAKDKEL